MTTEPTNPAAPGAAAAAAATTPPGDAGAGGESAGSGGSPDAAAGALRPDYLPEKFWDAEAGAPRVEQLAKSYGELEGERALRSKRPPETYALPEGLKPYEAQLPKAQVEALGKLAREEGYSQAGYEQLAAGVFGDPGQQVAALEQAYGDKLGETLEAVRLWAGTLGEDHAPAIAQLSSSAAGVKLLETLRRQSIERGLPGQPGEGAPALTEAALRAKMQDPKYWRDRDPTFIDEVTRGFQQLYGAAQVRTAGVNPGEFHTRHQAA